MKNHATTIRHGCWALTALTSGIVIGATCFTQLFPKCHEPKIMENYPMNPNHYLAIDPGQKRSGWARFDENGTVTGFGKVDGINEFMDWLESQPKPRVIIMEDYRVNPNISHAFSRVRTVETIGLIKRFCHQNEINLVEQRNLVLPIGLRYIGMYEVYYDGKGKKKKHVDDEISALAHGEYYLVKNKIKKHRRATDSD